MGKLKYNQRIKELAVKMALSDKYSYGYISILLGTHPERIMEWVSRYNCNGIDGLVLSGYRGKHSLELKLEVVNEVLNNGLSYRQAAFRYKLGGHQLVSVWCKRYKKQGIFAFEERTKSMKQKTPSKGNKPLVESDKDKRIRELELELEYLRTENAVVKKLQALVQSKQQKK